jgi:hypothetical protein
VLNCSTLNPTPDNIEAAIIRLASLTTYWQSAYAECLTAPGLP